ncbi:MAG: hypothetical protein C4B58_14165 [Deltaproteobacteria bacterium]|nr:MAG: hypothetical protein C4B58_14165 [Deltaproteobacteria bacterium]
MRKPFFICSFFVLIALCLSQASTCLSADWPASWTAYTSLGSDLIDPMKGCGNSKDPSNGGAAVAPACIDVFNGCSKPTQLGLPSVYVYYDSSAEVLFFRMRMAGDPSETGGLAQYTWNAILDVDGDGWKEFIVELDGGSNVLNVYYGNTNQQEIKTESCSTDTDGRVYQESLELNTNVRVTFVGSAEGYFLDFQVPLSAFDNCSGTQILSTTSPYSLSFSTSATSQNLTQKDYVNSGDAYTMNDNTLMPGGDLYSPSGGTTQDPSVTRISHTCGEGANYSPITLNATTLDTFSLSGGSVVDTIDFVKFYYQLSGESGWTEIASVTTPDTNTVNSWSTDWDTSGLTTGTYNIKVEVQDDQGYSTTNTSYSINLSDCGSLLVELTTFVATPDLRSVLLAWETATEIDNAGFYLWRTDAEDAEYIRITDYLIPAEGGLTQGATYAYEDFDVVPGLTYYYQLEKGGIHLTQVQKRYLPEYIAFFPIFFAFHSKMANTL